MLWADWTRDAGVLEGNSLHDLYVGLLFTMLQIKYPISMTDIGLSAYFCFLFEEMKTSIRGIIPRQGGGSLAPAC